MKGEYFIMNNIGLRRIFSLLLAVMMVCALLPTAAFAEDTAEPQAEDNGAAAYATSSTVSFNVSSIYAPFRNGTTGEHTVYNYTFSKVVYQKDVGSDNASGTATAKFVEDSEKGWQLVIVLDIGNLHAEYPCNAYVSNKDMSEATGRIEYGVSFNQTNPGTGTTLRITGAKDLPKPPQPDKPGKPTEDDIINNNILGDVTIECTNADVQHGSKSYPLTKESITSITEPAFDSNAGYYSCMVTVSSTSYVHQFDRDKGGVHTPDDKTKTIQLLYYADAWHGPSGDPSVSSILFKVACTEKPEPPKAPDAPSHDELSKLIGDITVNCTNGAATHTPKSKGYALIADSYTRGTVVENTDGGYTYAVTIKSEKYVNQFDTDTGSAHTPKDDEATVVLEYKDEAWTAKSGKPVSFNVACATEIVPPEKPVPADLGSFIKVICTTKKDVHGTAIYPLHEGRYAIGEVEGNAKDGYTCTITIEAAGYVATYSNAKGEEHTLVHENDASKTVTLTWDSAAKDWSRPDDVTFEVKCKTEVVPPTAPTLDELPDISVTLHCGTTSAHRDPTWRPLLKNTYEISTPTLKNDVYTCTLTIKAEKYVDEYSSTVYHVGKHELDDDATKDIVLTWDGQKWTAEKDSVTFRVKCSLYTVIYTDGVKNKVIFKDELHKDLAYGSDTPKFTGGTPKRTGYTFTGWSPKVADTVTGNVTYVAQWKSNSGKDNVPKTGSGEIAMILGSVLMFSFCGAAAVCVYDRKRRQR